MRLIQEGPRNAKIIAVGEAPGATEDATGRPFSGGSGQLFDYMLSRAGLSRSDIFVTNVCHTRPLKNDWSWFLRKDNISHLAAGIIRLKQDLQEIKPNLVIALGSQPLRVLTGKQGIEKWRGSILPCTLVPGIKVIGTYHPAYILRQYDYKVVAELDLARCRAESTNPELVRPSRRFILDPDHSTQTAIGQEMFEADWLAIDIECSERPDGTWSLACVGFSDCASRAMVIPVRTLTDKDYIRWLCGSPARKVLQNGTFDVTVLKAEGVEVVNFAWDTMLAHHSLFPECASAEDEISVLSQKKKKQAAIGKGLAFQTSMYTREPFYKDDGKTWKETGDLQMFWRYNALDAAITREIRDVQCVELRDFGTEQVFEHEMALVEPLMAMTERGIKIDIPERDRLRKEYDTKIATLQEQLNAAAGSPLNVKSSPQVKALLYETLKLPVKRHHKTGNATANKDALVELAAKHDQPLLKTIIAIRKARDIVERYLDCPLDKDGRIRCSFDITGTRSGRLSSRASIFGSGTNLQNQPPEIRRIFIADPGKVFVYADYSQAEARIVAYLAEEADLISLFSDASRDVHKENASRIFSKALETITYEERYLAKRVIHASNYGMREKRLVQIVNEDAETTGVAIDLPTAKRLLDAYMLLYPGIREVYWKSIEKALRDSRVLVSPFGRKRQFFGRWDDKLLRDAYSYPPQSCVGDLCCKALVACYGRIQKVVPGAELLLNVHDSLLMQCWEADVERVAGLMGEAMHIPITVKGHTFYIPTDCKIGLNWGEQKPDNPRGLIDIDKWRKSQETAAWQRESTQGYSHHG